MFGFLKNLMRKPAEAKAETQQPEAEASVPAPNPAHRSAPQAPAARSNGTRTAAAPPSNGQQNGTHQNGKGVEIPLQAVIDILSAELQPRLRQRNVGEAFITI